VSRWWRSKAPVDAADLSAQAARIKNADPDAILVTTIGGTFEVLAHNTFFQQMPKIPRFSLASIGNQPESWELAQPGALEGVVFMASIDMANENTKVLNDYLTELRGNDFYMTAYDAQGWDAVMLIRRQSRPLAAWT
jgi:branched-chain amino acid transport system substrate-binding protein